MSASPAPRSGPRYTDGVEVVEPRVVGRYEVWDELARGGMATVHVGRLVAARGFSRVVAIKCLREDRLGTGFYAEAFEDEARLGARLRHPNLVSALDIVFDEGRSLLVMEYVEGVSLADLRERGPVPAAVAARIVIDALRGLHAAHEARDAAGRSLGVVHRDVSPENVLVGVDGLARIVDFGVAKATGREQRTATGVVKGKALYMAPEQATGLPVSRTSDVWAAGAVLVSAIAPSPPTSSADFDALLLELPEPIARVARTAIERDPRRRFMTGAEMADALEQAAPAAAAADVARLVEERCGDELERRAAIVRRVEAAPSRAATAVVGSAAAPKAEPPPPKGDPAERGRSRRPLVIGLGVAAAVLAVGVVARSPSAPPSAPPPVAPVAVAEERRPLPEPPEAVDVPTSLAPPPPAPTASAPRPPPRPAGAPRGRPTRGSCDPPYDVDAMGRKHYRVECLDPR